MAECRHPHSAGGVEATQHPPSGVSREMKSRSKSSRVVELEATRRARVPTDDAAWLARIVDVQAEIAQAGLDPHRVVEVVTHRAQELTHSTGAVVELLDGDELFYWAASGHLLPHVGTRVASARSLSGL